MIAKDAGLKIYVSDRRVASEMVQLRASGLTPRSHKPLGAWQGTFGRPYIHVTLPVHQIENDLLMNVAFTGYCSINQVGLQIPYR